MNDKLSIKEHKEMFRGAAAFAGVLTLIFIAGFTVCVAPFPTWAKLVLCSLLFFSGAFVAFFAAFLSDSRNFYLLINVIKNLTDATKTIAERVIGRKMDDGDKEDK